MLILTQLYFKYCKNLTRPISHHSLYGTTVRQPTTPYLYNNRRPHPLRQSSFQSATMDLFLSAPSFSTLRCTHHYRSPAPFRGRIFTVRFLSILIQPLRSNRISSPKSYRDSPVFVRDAQILFMANVSGPALCHFRTRKPNIIESSRQLWVWLRGLVVFVSM